MPNKFAADKKTVATVDRGGLYCCEVCPTHLVMGRMPLLELRLHLRASHGMDA